MPKPTPGEEAAKGEAVTEQNGVQRRGRLNKKPTQKRKKGLPPQHGTWNDRWGKAETEEEFQWRRRIYWIFRARGDTKGRFRGQRSERHSCSDEMARAAQEPRSFPRFFFFSVRIRSNFAWCFSSNSLVSGKVREMSILIRATQEFSFSTKFWYVELLLLHSPRSFGSDTAAFQTVHLCSAGIPRRTRRRNVSL